MDSPKSAAGMSYEEKLKAHLQKAAAAVSNAENIALTAAVAVDNKAEAALLAEREGEKEAEKTAESPSSIVYNERLKERIGKAVAAVEQAEAAEKLSAVVKPEGVSANVSGPAPPRKIVVGPTIKDAVTRLENGFDVNLFFASDDHKAVSRRTYKLWFADRSLYWSAGTAKLAAAGQRLPVSDITHLYFGVQTKTFLFVNSALGNATAGLNPSHCFSLLTPTHTLDVEAFNKTDYRHFLACVNTLFESFGKLAFLESSSAETAAALATETRRFRIIPAADIEDDDQTLVATSSADASATSASAHPTAAKAVPPSVWVSPNETRFVFPVAVGKHGFRSESGHPVNTDITSLSRSALPFRNPNMFTLNGRTAALRIHFDPNGKTEADAYAEDAKIAAHPNGVVLRPDGTPASGKESEVEVNDSDSDAEDDLFRKPTPKPVAAAPKAVAKPAPKAAPVVVSKRKDVMGTAQFQGTVWKRSNGLLKRWELRWVAVLGRYFFKYENVDAHVGALNGHPIPIDLCDIEIVANPNPAPAPGNGIPAAQFRVLYHPPHGGAVREWLIGVSTPDTRAKWVAALLASKKLVTEKVAGRVKWTEADLQANHLAELANETSAH